MSLDSFKGFRACRFGKRFITSPLLRDKEGREKKKNTFFRSESGGGDLSCFHKREKIMLHKKESTGGKMDWREEERTKTVFSISGDRKRDKIDWDRITFQWKRSLEGGKGPFSFHVTVAISFSGLSLLFFSEHILVTLHFVRLLPDAPEAYTTTKRELFHHPPLCSLSHIPFPVKQNDGVHTTRKAPCQKIDAMPVFFGKRK